MFRRSSIPNDHIIDVDDADSDAGQDYTGGAILTTPLSVASNHSINEVTHTREVFGPSVTMSFPVREPTEASIPERKK